MTGSPTEPRAFEGLANFRDLGGTPVRGGGAIRAGLLFRSDSLSYASEADASYLVRECGLATIVDLRATAEVAEFGRGPLAAEPIDYIALPCTDVIAAETRSDYYFRLLQDNGDALADLVRRLTAPSALPAVVHCHIGCDRTGAVSAMLLGLSGAPDAAICTDYALSSRATGKVRERSTARRQSLGLPTMDRAYYDEWEPRTDIMAATLAAVAGEWGDWYGWASAYGLGVDEIAALRAALVAPTPATRLSA